MIFLLLIFNVFLGVQLISHSFKIDDSNSKCWSILAYSKRHETKLRHKISKAPWHVNDFVLASYTFSCAIFVPNNRSLWEVFIFLLHSKKMAAELHRELNETTCHDWFRSFKEGDLDVDSNHVKEGQNPSKTLHWRHCSNKTITEERYRVQLMRLSRVLSRKWP